MADVIIHGVEIPETCYECPCGDNEFYECMATKERFSYHRDEYGYPDGERQDWCPLEVKQPRTQADRIRAMNDEELDDFIEEIAPHGNWSLFLDGRRWIDWLREPVGGGDPN